jgi:hypothetical protein
MLGEREERNPFFPWTPPPPSPSSECSSHLGNGSSFLTWLSFPGSPHQITCRLPQLFLCSGFFSDSKLTPYLQLVPPQTNHFIHTLSRLSTYIPLHLENFHPTTPRDSMVQPKCYLFYKALLITLTVNHPPKIPTTFVYKPLQYLG